jgi:hypothetical protein
MWAGSRLAVKRWRMSFGEHKGLVETCTTQKKGSKDSGEGWKEGAQNEGEEDLRRSCHSSELD